MFSRFNSRSRRLAWVALALVFQVLPAEVARAEDPVDVTPPVVTVPADVVVDPTFFDSAIVTFPAATATDDIGVVSGPDCWPPSGSQFLLGDTTVTCLAYDAAGNEGSASFTVTVRFGVITGTVTDAGGAPLSGIEVNAFDSGGMGGAAAVTASDGTYSLEAAPGSYGLGFWDPTGLHMSEFYADKTYDTADFVTVAGGDVMAGIDVELADAGTVSGTVTEAGTGTALPDVQVEVWDSGFNEGWCCSITDANGEFVLGELATGSYLLRFSGTHIAEFWQPNPAVDARSFDDAEAFVVTAGSNSPDKNVVLDVGGAISGRVTDGTGAGIFDIQVDAVPGQQDPFGWSALTDADGDYTVCCLPSGSYTLEIRDWSGVYAAEYWNDAAARVNAQSIAVTAGSPLSGFDVVLVKAGTISGTVTADGGGALENVQVDALDPSGNVVGSGWTDDSGNYTVCCLPAGTYRVEFTDTMSVYFGEFFSGNADLVSADVVVVIAEQDTSQIDASLASMVNAGNGSGSWSNVEAGASVSTDGSGDGATVGQPVETSVTTPNSGVVMITSGPAGSDPTGYTLFGQTVTITAPAASAGSPLVLVFRIDSTLIPAGFDIADVVVLRNGVAVDDECPGSVTAVPDPCVQLREVVGDDFEVTVLTSAASDWNFAIEAVTSVTRYAGSNRYGTAAAISAGDFPDPSSVSTVFVATGLNYPDALAGAAVAGMLGAPLLLVDTNSIPGPTAIELARLSPDTIVILGGTSAVSGGVETALGAYASSVTRLAGANRYATAVQISQYGYAGTADTVIVATGAGFADALAGGPAAVALGGPVLLTDPATLPGVVAAEIARLSPSRIVVVGGVAAVSATVFNALQAIQANTVRISGSNRYTTAVAISEDAFAGGSNRVYVATGLNFPDALAGAAAAGWYGAPVLLVPGTSIPGTVSAEITRLGASQVFILGGTAVVTSGVATTLGILIGL